MQPTRQQPPTSVAGCSSSNSPQGVARRHNRRDAIALDGGRMEMLADSADHALRIPTGPANVDVVIPAHWFLDPDRYRHMSIEDSYRIRFRSRTALALIDRLWVRGKVTNMANSIVSTANDIMGGTPVFPGTRVPVQTLLDYIEAGDTIDDFLEGFPSVSREQVIAFLERRRKASRYRSRLKLLLDECVDRRLAEHLTGFQFEPWPRWVGQGLRTVIQFASLSS